MGDQGLFRAQREISSYLCGTQAGNLNSQAHPFLSPFLPGTVGATS